MVAGAREEVMAGQGQVSKTWDVILRIVDDVFNYLQRKRPGGRRNHLYGQYNVDIPRVRGPEQGRREVLATQGGCDA